jgi:putative transposase
MSRIARIVLPGIPHHVTQRGVRSMVLFETEDDRRYYLRVLKEQAGRFGLEFKSYCLMSNHIHLVVVPQFEDSLRKAIGQTHLKYTLRINSRNEVRGHLFQERFYSCPMDDQHFIAACRYVERNPVRAGLVQQAWDFVWSSARFHVGIADNDFLIESSDWHSSSEEWKQQLSDRQEGIDNLRKHFKTGRPLGSESFVRSAIAKSGVVLPRKKVGRPQKK